jgi:hypothetical protein
MIIRWMIVGIVLWVAVAAVFRFVPEAAVSWVFMTLPAAMLLVTHFFLRIFRVAETDRGEAASIMALPGLLVGIYAINSFNYVFENPSLTLGPQFATLMFACYAAVLIAGLVSVRVVVGFLLWIGVAVAFRFYGQLVFHPGEDGVSSRISSSNYSVWRRQIGPKQPRYWRCRACSWASMRSTASITFSRTSTPRWFPSSQL